MTADVPTLLLMIIVTSLVTSGALLVLNGNQRNDGLQYWAGGLLLSALAHTLLLLYGRIPNLLTVVLGNVLLSSALASFWLAVRRFHDLALHWARTLALLAAIALLMWLFQHQFASRVVVSGFTLSLQRRWCCGCCALGAEQQRSRGALLLVWTGPADPAAAGRAALFFSLNIASILQSNLVQTLTFMVSFLATLVSSFGFVFMAKERADANLRLASQDPLTGAANRRALMQALETELARASRQHTPLALLMVDIDHFKRVNDHYGHLAGDHVLRHIVGVLRQRLRASDVLGRYGGEEFMVLLPGTDLHGAAQLAEQLRQAVQAAPCEWQGQRIAFTVSIGVAASADTPADPSRTSEALLQAADQALYRAKDDGRNRVALA
jgi:diguanylate cyclase (GGDEF)-like protein